jgi:hypothetical protein
MNNKDKKAIRDLLQAVKNGEMPIKTAEEILNNVFDTENQHAIASSGGGCQY